MSANDGETGSLTPADLMAAAEACSAALRPLAEADWSVLAGDLDWDCRHTLDHVLNALVYYSIHLSSGSALRLPTVRTWIQSLQPVELVTLMVPTASILASVASAVPPDRRAFHSAGLADVTGFLAMGCTEMLVHTFDVAKGLGQEFSGPADISRRVVQRIFPWAPPGFDDWSTLLWSAGRIELPGLARLEGNWSWHCAPLSEWDGQRVVGRFPAQPVQIKREEQPT